MYRPARILGITFLILELQACSTLPTKASNHNSVVGAWFVQHTDAPFPYHM